MFFKKMQKEKRILWKIEIDGLNMERKPQYTVYKTRAPYGWDCVCCFTDLDKATEFVEKHLNFPKYFYEDLNV